MSGLDIDAGLDSMLADYREQAEETGAPLHANAGAGVTRELEHRAEARAASAEFEEQLAHDERASVRQIDTAPDGGYRVERADGTLEEFEAGTGPFAQEALEQGFEQTNEIMETAQQLQDWFNESPYESWEEVREELPEAYEQASYLFAAAEQLAQVEAAELVAAEEEQRLRSDQIEAADEDPEDLATAVAQRAQNRAEDAFVARNLDPEVGWGSDSSRWAEDAQYARELAAAGIDPNDPDLVDRLYPYIEATEDGDVPQAVAMMNADLRLELAGELQSWEIDPDSEAAQQIVHSMAQHGDTDVETALRRLYPEYPGWSE